MDTTGQMVARDSGTPRSGTRVLTQVLAWWTTALEAVAEVACRTWRATCNGLGRLRTGDLAPLSSWPFLSLAAGCVLVGALIRLAASSAGPDRVSAATAGVAAIGWALGRLGLMVLVLGTQDRAVRRARGAWAAGAVVWAIAVVPIASFIAWVASGVISLLVLRGLGEPMERARKAILIAWGVHAVASLASWIVVNGWFAAQLS